MSKKFKIELDDDILKKLKHEDLMLILGIQKLSESKKYELDTSLAEIGRLSFEETTKENKSNPIVDIINTKNNTISEKKIDKAKKDQIIENKDLKPQVQTKESANKPKPENEKISNNLSKKPDLESKKNDEPSTNLPKPELKFFFHIISINQDLSIEDNINIAKN